MSFAACGSRAGFVRHPMRCPAPSASRRLCLACVDRSLHNQSYRKRPITTSDNTGRSGVERTPAVGSGSGAQIWASHGRGSLSSIGDPATSLVARIEGQSAVWSETQDVDALVDAFNELLKVASARRASPQVCRRAFDILAAAFLPLVPTLQDPKSCIVPLTALSQLGFWHGGLAEALLVRLGTGADPTAGSAQRTSLMAQADRRGHATLWSALAAAPPNVVTLAEQALQASSTALLHMTLEQLGAHACATVLLVSAQLERREGALVQHLVAGLVASKATVEVQDLANSLYALALLGCTGPAYTAALQQLCSAAWARLLRQRASFTARDLSNTLWALEMLQPPGQQSFVRALAVECLNRRFAGFVARDFGNAASALANMGWDDQDWYETLMAAAGQPGAMDGATPQDWSELWYALAMAQYRPEPAFFEAMLAPCSQQSSGKRKGATHLEVFHSQAGAQECTALLYALAALSLQEQRLLDVTVGRLRQLPKQRRKRGLAGQGLANSLWALAVMGPEVLLRHSDLVEGLLLEAVRRWGGNGRRDYEDVDLRQLWQVQLELVHLGGDRSLDRILAAGEDSPHGSLLSAARRAAEEQGLTPGIMSPMHYQVLTSLLELKGCRRKQPGWDSAGASADGPILGVRQECPIDELCCCVDVLVEVAGGRRVVVEVDGPSHFLGNSTYTGVRVGSTQLRDRQLKRVFGEGNVVSVPYWEWRELRDEGERQQYLSVALGLLV